MRCIPSDPCGIHAPAGNLLRAIVVALPRLVIWHRPHSPRLRLLTGTRPQQAALVLAIRPVVREISPTLEAAGVEVNSIAIVPTLTGSAGEPLQAEVEQVNGSNAVGNGRPSGTQSQSGSRSDWKLGCADVVR